MKGGRVWRERRGMTLAEVVEVALAVGAAAVARGDAGHGLGDEGPTAAGQRESLRRLQRCQRAHLSR